MPLNHDNCGFQQAAALFMSRPGWFRWPSCSCLLVQDQNGAMEIELHDLKSRIDSDTLEMRQLEEKLADQRRMEVCCKHHVRACTLLLRIDKTNIDMHGKS
jgi:hypothetical protein